eukprot:jgi/Astpho2/2754/Aster-00931
MVKPIMSLHRLQLLGPKAIMFSGEGKATGSASSQVEQDRTGGKPTGPVPDSTEHGTVPRPAAPSFEDDQSKSGDQIRPGASKQAFRPGQVPPGYDTGDIRGASASEQTGKSQQPGPQTIGQPEEDTQGKGASEDPRPKGGPVGNRPERNVGNHDSVDSSRPAGFTAAAAAPPAGSEQRYPSEPDAPNMVASERTPGPKVSADGIPTSSPPDFSKNVRAGEKPSTANTAHNIASQRGQKDSV